MNICDVIVILNVYIVQLLCYKIAFHQVSRVEDLFPVPENVINDK